MNAGLPGTGIGGLFYIASALWMPAHRALTGHTHEGRDWRRVLAQAGIAGGVLASLFMTGWLLGLMIAPEAAGAAGAAGAGTSAVRSAHNLVRLVAVIGTAGLLAAVLLAVEAAHLVVQFRGRGTTVLADGPARVPKWRRTPRRVA
jgi:hypothetical protein